VGKNGCYDIHHPQEKTKNGGREITDKHFALDTAMRRK
jgi:hypothetical protein